MALGDPLTLTVKDASAVERTLTTVSAGVDGQHGESTVLFGPNGAIISPTNPMAIQQVAQTVTTARSTIATAGTPAQLQAGSLTCRSVAVTALPTNTLRVVLGESTSIDASDGSLRGYPLEPGEKVTLAIDNVNKVYYDVLVNNEGVTWFALS